jgi:ribosome maturation factor RimP
LAHLAEPLAGKALMVSGKQLELEQLLLPTIQRAGFELWGLEYAPQAGTSMLRIYLEHAERAVTIDDCESISREISALMDVEDPIAGEYQLEVSSPGVDRPLFSAAQFARYIGEEVKLETLLPVEGRRRFKGTIAEVVDTRITLKMDQQSYTLAERDIAKARIVPDYVQLLRVAKSKSKSQTPSS